MKTLLLILILPLSLFSQNLEEFQLFRWNKTFIKPYRNIDSLKGDLRKYNLFTTNITVNNQVSELINKSMRNVAKTMSSRFSQGATIDFIDSQSEELQTPLILREFQGDDCCKCANSIYQRLVEDFEIKSIIENTKCKKIFVAYLGVKFREQNQFSWIIFYYKIKGQKTMSILISLEE